MLLSKLMVYSLFYKYIPQTVLGVGMGVNVTANTTSFQKTDF